jgi:hypothetical protein
LEGWYVRLPGLRLTGPLRLAGALFIFTITCRLIFPLKSVTGIFQQLTAEDFDGVSQFREVSE